MAHPLGAAPNGSAFFSCLVPTDDGRTEKRPMESRPTGDKFAFTIERL